jgi:hypothetical protein
MSAEDGVFLDLLKPGARAKALWRGALDLIFPPQALDGGEASMSGGLSAASWSRIHFLDGPVCDGCGAFFGPERSGSPQHHKAGISRGSER